MARTNTLQGLRDQIIHSLHGRQLGLTDGGSTFNNTPHFLAGPAGFRQPIQAVTTATTGDNCQSYGVVTLACTTTSASTMAGMQPPIPGVPVKVVNISTGIISLFLNNSTITTGVVGYSQWNAAAGATGLSTCTVIKLSVAGASVSLMGLSTSTWLVEAQGSSLTTYGSSFA